MLPRNIGHFVTVETTRPSSWITGVMLCEIVDDETHRAILEKWEGPVIGFGGGVETVAMRDIIDECNNNPRTMARRFGITIKVSKEILDKAAEISKRESR